MASANTETIHARRVHFKHPTFNMLSHTVVPQCRHPHLMHAYSTFRVLFLLPFPDPTGLRLLKTDSPWLILAHEKESERDLIVIQPFLTSFLMIILITWALPKTIISLGLPQLDLSIARLIHKAILLVFGFSPYLTLIFGTLTITQSNFKTSMMFFCYSNYLKQMLTQRCW